MSFARQCCGARSDCFRGSAENNNFKINCFLGPQELRRPSGTYTTHQRRVYVPVVAALVIQGFGTGSRTLDQSRLPKTKADTGSAADHHTQRANSPPVEWPQSHTPHPG